MKPEPVAWRRMSHGDKTEFDREFMQGWGYTTRVLLLEDEPLYTASALAEVRRAALEEAAMACESKRRYGPYAEWELQRNEAVIACADAIRALKKLPQ